MNVILLEDVRSLPAVDSYIRQSDEEAVVVALSPEVVFEMDRRGLPFKTTDDYVDQEILYQVGQDNYPRLEQFGLEIGREFEGIFAEAGLPGLNPVFLNYENFKRGYDSFTFRIHELLAVFTHESPELVLYSDEGPKPSTKHTLMGLSGEEPIYSLLAPLAASKLDIPSTTGPFSLNERDRRSPFGLAEHYLQGSVRRALRLRQEAIQLWSSRGWRKSENSRPPTAIVSSGVHDLGQIENILETSGTYTVVDDALFWAPLGRRLALGPKGSANQHPSLSLSSLALAWRNLKDMPNIREFFCQDGVAWDGLIAPWLEQFFTQGIREIAEYYEIGDSVAQKYRPKFMLTVRKGDHTHAAFSSALQNAGIPVVYSQEGGGYGYATNPLDYHVDLCRSDYFMSYGPGVVEHLHRTKMTERQTATPVSIGSAKLSEIRKNAIKPNLAEESAKDPGRKITVMYVPTKLNHSISFNYTPLDTTYFQMQKRIFETLAEFPSINVILKMGPGKVGPKSPLKELARSILTDPVIVEEPFMSVVDRADAIIVDWPSTVFLEALSTRLPVIAYMDLTVARVEPMALDLLSARAFVNSSFEDFLGDIRRFAANPADCAAAKDVEDTKFMEQYAFPVEGPDVASRLVSFLKTLHPVGASS